MSNPKDASFDHLLNLFAKHYVDAEDEKNKVADFKLTLSSIGILAFAGYEAVKVLYRKNFGMSLKGFVRLAICFFCFVVIAIISFMLVDSTDNFASETGTPDSHLVSGIVYTVLAITIMVKGFIDRNKVDSSYEGDSNVLAFLMKDQHMVQNLAEPLLTITIGIAACFFDLMGGIPIIFCGLCVWANLVFGHLSQNNSLQEKISRLNDESNTTVGYHEIKTD